MTERVDIGGCTLYRADCRDVLSDLPAAGLCLTDPPYGANYESAEKVATQRRQVTMDGTRVSIRLYRDVVPMLRGIPTLWFTRWDVWPDVWEVFAARSRINGLLIWEKAGKGLAGLGTGNLRHWATCYEMIASVGEVRTGAPRESSVLRFPTVPPRGRLHPTQKPLELIEYLVGKCTAAGDVVLDPFMGAATAAVACARLGRRFVGVEIEPVHFDAACRRVEAAYREPGNAGDYASPRLRMDATTVVAEAA